MSTLSDEELIERLRKCAAVWFKNSDLLQLEELIRRYHRRGVLVQLVHSRLTDAKEATTAAEE